MLHVLGAFLSWSPTKNVGSDTIHSSGALIEKNRNVEMKASSFSLSMTCCCCFSEAHRQSESSLLYA